MSSHQTYPCDRRPFFKRVAAGTAVVFELPDDGKTTQHDILLSNTGPALPNERARASRIVTMGEGEIDYRAVFCECQGWRG